MLEALALLLPQLEHNAAVLEAEYRTAQDRERAAAREARVAYERSVAADKLLDVVRTFLADTYPEVPL